MVVEDGDVDAVEVLVGLLDGGGGDALVAVLAQDGGTEMKVCRVIVEQQDANRGEGGRSCGAGVGRFADIAHKLVTSSMHLSYL